MSGRRGFLAAYLVGSIVAGCVGSPASPSPSAAAPTSSASAVDTPSPSATPKPALGAPLALVDRPNAQECDQVQREDRLAAERMRKGVSLSLFDIGATDDAIAAAASDPLADVDLIGIPLRVDELETLRSGGMTLDDASPLAFWVHEGRTDLFGGIWIDPPGGGRYVVSVVDGDLNALKLARCLERGSLDVRYVMAEYSLAQLNAVADRLSKDRSMLQGQGIRIVSSGPDVIANRMTIEVEGLTDEQAMYLTRRYGDALFIEALPVPTPRLPLSLKDVPFAFGMDPLFEPPGSNGVAGGPGATWELLEGRLAEDQIRLRVSVEPAPHGLPLGSGPAVLFVGMQAFGGAGDMGMVEQIDTLVVTTLPACNDRRCRYEATIDLPTDGIMHAVRRLEPNDMMLSVNMTLVRTFAGGTWLQVLPLEGDRSQLAGGSGRLGSISSVGGTSRRLGLFPSSQAEPVKAGNGTLTTDFDYAPAVEQRRVATVDPSEAAETVSVSLHVTSGQDCAKAAIAIQTDGGDVAFQAPIRDRTSFKRDFSILPGVIWRLTLNDGWGIDYALRGGWGASLGEIRTDGDPITVEASLYCGLVPDGTLTVEESP